MPKADKRPGILLYFDLLDALEEYELSERAEFIYALRDYAANGVCPVFQDRGLRGLWKTTQPTIDRDGERYEEKVQKARYSAYVGAAKRKGTEFLSYEDWVAEIERTVADGSDRSRTVADGSDRSRTVADGSQYNNKLQYQDELQPQDELQIQPQPHFQTEHETDNKPDKHQAEECQEDRERMGVWGQEGERRGIPTGHPENLSVIPENVSAIHRQYLQAMEAGDKTKACTLSNKLYSLGYNVDISTGKLERRKP